MTATYDDWFLYADAWSRLDHSHVMTKIKESAREYAQWIVSADPKGLVLNTYDAKDFDKYFSTYSFVFDDSSESSIGFHDYHAERYFRMPADWITRHDKFVAETLAKVQAKQDAAEQDKSARKEAAKQKRLEKYLKLREEFD